jgi:L-lactate dehydrogenase complex protein LldE
MRVALFVTCLGDVLFPQVPRATTVLLERRGPEPEHPTASGIARSMPH